MKVLITGATGFVGSHVTREVAADGHEVRLLVRDTAKAARVLTALNVSTEAELVVGDMTDATAVGQAVSGCDAVIHAAAEIGVAGGSGPTGAINAEGVRVVIGAAVEAGVDPILYTSTVTVHLPTEESVLTADSPLAEPRSTYAASKRDAELLVRKWQEQGAPITCFAVGGVYGPYSPHLQGSFAAVTGALEAMMLIPPGGLGVVDVRDLATVMARALQSGRGPQRYMAGGAYVTWEEWTNQLATAAGVDILRHRVSAEEMLEIGRQFDVQRVAGQVDGPLSQEAAEIMVSGVPTDDSRLLEDFDFQWRPIIDTFSDTVAYLRRIGRLPAVPQSGNPGPEG